MMVGKHGTEYVRADRDHYPTPGWVVEALAEHVELAGKAIWEPAAGTGEMVAALRAAQARVYATDIHHYGFPLDATADFLIAALSQRHFDAVITNPPYGERNKMAESFIEAGLWRVRDRGESLALLLPNDFDSTKGRPQFFADCAEYAGKIVLTQRIVWFERADGVREAPRENHAWFLWAPCVLRRPPIVLYAPRGDDPLTAPSASAGGA
jgi:hypothetical protein